MIIATSKDGLQRHVIFNDTILLVDSDDKLSFSIKDDKLNIDIVFYFTFSDNGEENSTSGNISDDGKIFDMILYKWNASLGTELTKPIELTNKAGKRIWVKFRTAADKKHSFRLFHLTIWGEE